MKKPDTWKHESWLRRILDADKFDSIVYFEEAVLADSNTLHAKGYHLFLITENSFHFLQSQKDSSLSSSNSWMLTDFHAVQHLNDPALFFGDSPVAHHSRHIRCHVSDQAASPVAVIDFYSFYEDSALYHRLFQAWQHAHARAALPAFYPTEKNKLNRLSKLAVQALYNHLEHALLSTGRDEEEEKEAAAAAAAATAAAGGSAAAAAAPAAADGGLKPIDENPSTPLKPKRSPSSDDPSASDEERKEPSDGGAGGAGGGGAGGGGAEAARARAQAAKLRAKRRRQLDNDYWDVRVRTRILEEMSLAASAHRAFKALAFESARLIPFLLGELRSLGRLRAYLLGADPAHIWALLSARADLLVEDEVDAVRYAMALWTFLSRLLSGSEPLPARTRLLAWHSTSRDEELKQVMDDIFLLGGIPLRPERGAAVQAQQQQQYGAEPPTPAGLSSPGAGGAGGESMVTPSQFLEALDAHIDAGGGAAGGGAGRARFVDEEDRRFSQQYLYNQRAQRRWKEGVLVSHGDALLKESSASGAATRGKLSAQMSSQLHVRDAARIVAVVREEAAALAARRGPAARRRNAAAAAALDPPRTAEEVGYETVLLTNESASRAGLASLVSLIPELEVSFVECLFHFSQLLEHVLEVRVPYLTCNLDSLFRHLLDSEAQRDFKAIQVPVLARGLVHLVQKERRATLSYYCFVYASVVSKLMLRSAGLQQLLEDQHFLAMLAGPTRAAQSGAQLQLLQDITASVHANAARGLHFYQRTKPLLQHMLDLMIHK